MKKKLTVLITTYNRKVPLLEQLRSLERQGQFDKYSIIVADNHSDYDIKEWLSVGLSAEFLDIVQVIRRPYNIGGDLNITLSFQYPDTEWVWLLSDDDITEPDSIQTILNDIDINYDNEICLIKYSISGEFPPNKDIVVDKISEFFNYFTGEHSAGEMIFMSNNVYRMSDMNECFTKLCMYNFTSMSQIILPLLAMKDRHKKILLRSSRITNYVAGRISYNLAYVYLKYGNVLSVLPLYLNKEDIRAYRRLLFFSPRNLVRNLYVINDNAQRWECFKRIFISHYHFFSVNGIKVILYYVAALILGIDNKRKN